MGHKVFFETTLETTRINDLTDAGIWSDRLFGDSIERWVSERPESPVIHDRFGTLTWGEFGEQVDAASRGLLEIGVRASTVVQVQLPNWRHFAVIVAAVERIGGVVNPVAPIFRTHEILVMSELARPSVVVTAMEYQGFELGAMHVEVRERCPWVEELIVVGDSVPVDAMGWDELLEQGRFSSYDRAAVDLLSPSANDVCEVMFTSGTTGQPKGVMHTQNTLNTSVDTYLGTVADGVHANRDRPLGSIVFHMASTLAHQTGYLYGIRTPLMSGGEVVLQDVWDPDEFIELVERHGINISMGATPFLADVLAIDGVSDRDLESFQRFVCGGAAVPEPMLERARQLLPCVVLPGWGMTECGLLTVGRPGDSFEVRLTDGVAAEGNEVRVVDPDGMAVVGEQGDLQCKGSLLFAGYVQGRELTDSCWTGDWFDTGDRAVIDVDGYIKITGRTKDILIRGGENVPVKEIEDVLLRHPQVGGVAIVAQPHERLGEIGCAFVLAEGEEPTLADLAEFLAEHSITKQFWPEALRFVDEFPMTPSGKVQKYKLRAEL